MLTLGVLISMSAQTRFVATMPFASTPLEALTAAVNQTTEEIPLRPASLNHLLLLISVTMCSADPMLFALLVSACASLASREMLKTFKPDASHPPVKII